MNSTTEANRQAIREAFEAWHAGTVRIRSIHADGDTVIVVWDGRGVANDGRPCENTYAWVMRMRDGQVVDGTAFYDSISFNDLWSRVEPG